VAVLGTAPALPGTSGANSLIYAAVGYAATQPATGSVTGLYVSLNCEYSTASAGTSVPLLAGVEGIGTAGGLTVQGGLACADAGTANKWEAVASGTFGGFASSTLSGSSWPSPSCPVQEAFDSWPTLFTPVAYDAASDATANFTASDGATGQPYILLGAPVSTATAVLASSTGGQVPAGSTVGGRNPAARAVSQAESGGVNTENGDYSTSGADLSIPTFGPSLDFTRTYDAQVAQQQTRTGMPGSMGYGWTDNWSSSLSAASPVRGDIYTLAGEGTDNGDGGSPTAAPLNAPGGVTWNNGNEYIADSDGNRIQEIPGTSGTHWGQSMTAGEVYTVAGSPSGASGHSANGTTAGQSLLYIPTQVAFDSAGDMYIADAGNSRIVEIPVSAGSQWGISSMAANDLYTVAGNWGGASGQRGNGTLASSAFLNGPQGVAFDSHGDMYIADTGNIRIQYVYLSGGPTWEGQSMTSDDVYTIAGNETQGHSPNGTVANQAEVNLPEGVSISSAGDIYIADTGNNRIAEVAKAAGTQWNISMSASDMYAVAGSATGASGDTSTNGTLATSALLDNPTSVLSGNGQQLYITDSANNRIVEVARTGHTEWNISMSVNDLYTIAGSATGTAGFSGDGGAATAAHLNSPLQVSLDSSNNLYIADSVDERVREVSATTYDIATIAGSGATFQQEGNGGPATSAALNKPATEAFDPAGDVFIADYGNNRVQEIAATTHTQFGISMTAADVYTVAGNASGHAGISGDGGKGYLSYLDAPLAVAVDASGNLYIADASNNRIQELSAATGTISTAAGSPTGTYGTSGDGGPATAALLDTPLALAVDSAGDLYITDSFNNRIQEIYASGGQQWGHTGWVAGDIYTVAGSATGSSGDSGDGGAATSALLAEPEGVAADRAGNLYIADFGNNRVQEVPVATGQQNGQAMTRDDMYTIAGSASGSSGVGGDGVPATSSKLDAPAAVAADAAGDVYIADYYNSRVQEVAAANGTQWGQAMSADDVYTVAGSAAGTAGDSGDGGPATSALIWFANGVSVDPASDLYITDASNGRLREVTSATVATITPAPGQTSALYPVPGTTVNGTTYPGGITVTQPGGAQVTFYAQSGGTCTAPYVTAGQYCALPQDVGATLTYNSSAGIYTFTPQPGTSYTYNTAGQLTSETDADGDTLTLSYGVTLPGYGQCPSTANWCQVITSASGRTLTVGYNAANLVTSVTDPMGRRWTYGYTSSDLTSATDPMGNVTSYAYGAGSTGNPLNANDLLTITSPNGQPGGPDAGKITTLAYNAAGQVTSETDPMGYATTYTWTGFNPATGNGVITVTDPDQNKTVYYYTQGTLGARSVWTGTTLTSEQDFVPDQSGTGTSAGTQLDTASSDANGNIATVSYDTSGTMVSATMPDGQTNPGGGEQLAAVTQASTSLDLPSCSSDATAAETCQQDPPPCAGDARPGDHASVAGAGVRRGLDTVRQLRQRTVRDRRRL